MWWLAIDIVRAAGEKYQRRIHEPLFAAIPDSQKRVMTRAQLGLKPATLKPAPEKLVLLNRAGEFTLFSLLPPL